MAFQNKNLAVIAYANGLTMWNYSTPDDFSKINSKYFPAEIIKLMAVGDIFIVRAADGVYFRYVSSLKDNEVILSKTK